MNKAVTQTSLTRWVQFTEQSVTPLEEGRPHSTFLWQVWAAHDPGWEAGQPQNWKLLGERREGTFSRGTCPIVPTSTVHTLAMHVL